MSPAPSDATSGPWSAMFTWRAEDARRMESVRVQLSGKRIKANGRIVAAATDTNPAFAAYYDLLTDENGATKRLGMTVTSAERERQLVVARDNQNIWLVTDHRGDSRSAYDGALDVDVVFSPFFNALPIRRLGLTERADTVTVPTIYISVPEISISSAKISYSSSAAGEGEGIKVHSPVSDTVLTVDANGFIVDYPTLAVRI